MRRPFQVVGLPARLAAVVAAGVLLCSCHVSAGTAGGTSGATIASASSPATVLARRWTAFERSGVLSCLGTRVEQRAVVLSTGAMRRASGAALAAHADLRAAAHAAARTSVLLATRRSSTSAACRRSVTGAVSTRYVVSTSLLPDRPTVWRGAALGDLAARRLAGPS
jgi:hypothetical protein